MPEQPAPLPAICFPEVAWRQEKIDVPEIPIPFGLINQLQRVGQTIESRVVKADIGAGPVLPLSSHRHPSVPDPEAIKPNLCRQQSMKVTRRSRFTTPRKSLFVAPKVHYRTAELLFHAINKNLEHLPGLCIRYRPRECESAKKLPRYLLQPGRVRLEIQPPLESPKFRHVVHIAVGSSATPEFPDVPPGRGDPLPRMLVPGERYNKEEEIKSLISRESIEIIYSYLTGSKARRFLRSRS